MPTRPSLSKLIRKLLQSVRQADFVSETQNAVQVERGIVLPLTITNAAAGAMDLVASRLARISADPASFERLSVVDAAGHRRDVYLPVLVTAWLKAFCVRREEAWKQPLHSWCKNVRAMLDSWGTEVDPFSAARGAEVAAAAWSATLLSSASKLFDEPEWREEGNRLVERLVSAQQPNGSCLGARASDSPESWWYHELVILHALFNHAVEKSDPIAAGAVERAVRFHVSETQPDHATEQPWALAAFATDEAGVTMAEQMVHTAMAREPAGVSGLSALLLADAVLGIELAERGPAQ